jgi:hypothetical protein
MRKVVASALFAVGALTCQAESLYTPGGFVTGNEYRQKSETSRYGYLQGLFDGYMFAPFIAGSNHTTAVRLHDCASQMTPIQLSAIVDKFMNENPERWGEEMNLLAYSAIFLACQKIGKPLGRAQD